MPNTDKIITGVFRGTINTHNLPKDYYNDVRADMLAAVKKGIGTKKGFEPLMEDLELNAQAFSAAKTYNLISELDALKKDLSNFDDFQTAAKKKIDLYDIWGDAEVNTAQQQTYQAKQWQIITEDADLFPLLKYSTIGDACAICKPLDGLVAPVNSPIWRKIYPCNHYNCYCIVTQETASIEITDTKRRDELMAASVELMNPVFAVNPGITKQLFTNKHPYFASVPKSDRDFAKENFGLPIK